MSKDLPDSFPDHLDPCPQCSQDVTASSIRWNGFAWEHKNPDVHPQAGHHIMDPDTLEAKADSGRDHSKYVGSSPDHLTPVHLAKWLHERYEEIAAEEGWDTQESTQAEFSDLPEENRQVMVRLAERLMRRFTLADPILEQPGPRGDGSE